MIRRVTLAAVAGAVVAVLVAGQAGAFTRLQAFCVKQARTNSKNALASSKDRKSTRLNSSHIQKSRMPSSA